MKKLVSVLLMIGFLVAGCTGSFMLTQKVYDFHRDQTKWMDEVIFLGAVILPVYSLATLCDGVIFNSIEFWTGDNPIAQTQKESKKVLVKGDVRAVLTYNEGDDTIRIDSFKSQSPNESLIIERNDSGVIAKDFSGNMVYVSSTDTNGGISVCDANENVVRYFSPEEIQLTKKKFLN
ncbi:MAG: DUF3332 family protein [Thermodesulfobacteriota bacterium]|nr:DUF3332 family protein [Thermodesulfobacteriota bacterium]